VNVILRRDWISEFLPVQLDVLDIQVSGGREFSGVAADFRLSGNRAVHLRQRRRTHELLGVGVADLAADLGLTPREDSLEILHARSRLVLDSRAAGIRAPFDGVHLHIEDAAGLLAQARLAREVQQLRASARMLFEANPDKSNAFGAVNALVGLFGVPPQDWLFNQTLVMPAIIVVAIWAALPVHIIFFLAALQGVPQDLYEAASIDGAGRWQQFGNVTWPLITPTTFFLLIITLIGSMTGGFDIVWNMTQGGPLDASDLFIVQLYRTAFVYFQMGYASAMAYALFVIILVVTVFQWRAQKRWVHYS